MKIGPIFTDLEGGKTNRKAKMSGGLIVYKSNHSFIQILYSKIIDILRKITYQRGHRGIIGKLDEATEKFKNSKSSPFINILDIDINLIDDNVNVIDNFKKQFLTEPHEKSS